MADLSDLDRPNPTEEQLWEYLHHDEDLPVSRRAVSGAYCGEKSSQQSWGETTTSASATASTGSHLANSRNAPRQSALRQWASERQKACNATTTH